MTVTNNTDSNSQLYRVDEWFPDLSLTQRKNLRLYFNEFIKYNKTISLVPQKTVASADAYHFGDSILASKMLFSDNFKGNEIYDLGSGAGLPGVIIGILNPELRVVCVDFDLRKIEFIRHIANTLGLPNIVAEQQQAENIKDGTIEYAITRGLNTITRTLLMMRKGISDKGAIYHMKGDEWGVELSELPSQLCSIWAPSLVGEYQLPINTISKSFLVKTERIG